MSHYPLPLGFVDENGSCLQNFKSANAATNLTLPNLYNKTNISLSAAFWICGGKWKLAALGSHHKRQIPNTPTPLPT